MDLDLGFSDILKDVLGIERKQVLVGIQESARTHAQYKNGRNSKVWVPIAQYAAFNEFGTDKIPERSFMRSTFDQKIGQIEQITINQLGLVVDRAITLTNAFERLGSAVEGMVKVKITEIRSPPNSPYTIAKKRSSKPLIDFGQMFAAVRYVVKNARSVP